MSVQASLKNAAAHLEPVEAGMQQPQVVADENFSPNVFLDKSMNKETDGCHRRNPRWLDEYKIDT